MLRRQPPFAACRVGRLRLDLEEGEQMCVEQLCEAAAQSADSLRSLALADWRAAGEPAALPRLLQAARALESLELHACGLDPGQLPLLTDCWTARRDSRCSTWATTAARWWRARARRASRPRCAARASTRSAWQKWTCKPTSPPPPPSSPPAPATQRCAS